MGKSVVRLGDLDVFHCAVPVRAGNVTAPNVFVNGKSIQRQGDINSLHKKPPFPPPFPCPTHTAGIAVGSTKVFANNKGVGRTGDAIAGCTACGKGSTNVFAG